MSKAFCRSLMLFLVSLAVGSVAAHDNRAQDSSQPTATVPVYLPGGLTSMLSVLLTYLREPSLLEAAKDPTVRSFRVSYFSPVPVHLVAVRIIVNADGSGQITSAVSFSGAAKDVRRTANNVSKAEVDKLLELVDKAGFWATVSVEPQPDENGRIYLIDGSWWMLEGIQNASFHYVFRRNPKPTPITEIGCYLAKNLVKPDDGSVIPMTACVSAIQADPANAQNRRYR